MKDVTILVFLSCIAFHYTNASGITEWFESRKEKKESDKEYQLRMAKEMAERLYGVDVVNGSLELRDSEDSRSLLRPARASKQHYEWLASDTQLGLPERPFPGFRRIRRSAPVTIKLDSRGNTGQEDSSEDEDDAKKKVERINSVVDTIFATSGNDVKKELGLYKKEGKILDTKVLQGSDEDVMAQMSTYISSCVKDALKDSMGPRGYYPLPTELQSFLVWMMHGAEGGGECPPGRPEVRKPFTYLFHDDKHKPQFSVCNSNAALGSDHLGLDCKKPQQKMYDDMGDKNWRNNDPLYQKLVKNMNNVEPVEILRKKRSESYEDLLDFNTKNKSDDDRKKVIYSVARKCTTESCFQKKPDKHWCITHKDWQEMMRDDRNYPEPSKELEDLLEPAEEEVSTTVDSCETSDSCEITEDSCHEDATLCPPLACTVPECTPCLVESVTGLMDLEGQDECSTSDECATTEECPTTCSTACTTKCTTTGGTTVKPCASGKPKAGNACSDPTTTKCPKTPKMKCRPVCTSPKCTKAHPTAFPTCCGKPPSKKEGCSLDETSNEVEEPYFDAENVFQPRIFSKPKSKLKLARANFETKRRMQNIADEKLNAKLPLTRAKGHKKDRSPEDIENGDTFTIMGTER